MAIYLLVLMCLLSHSGFGGSRVVVTLYALNLGANQLTVGILMALYALVRTEDWAADTLRIVAVDLLEQEAATHEPELASERLEAHAWIAARVEVLTRNAAEDRPRPGADCAGCAFVAGCAAHG